MKIFLSKPTHKQSKFYSNNNIREKQQRVTSFINSTNFEKKKTNWQKENNSRFKIFYHINNKFRRRPRQIPDFKKKSRVWNNKFIFWDKCNLIFTTQATLSKKIQRIFCKRKNSKKLIFFFKKFYYKKLKLPFKMSVLTTFSDKKPNTTNTKRTILNKNKIRTLLTNFQKKQSFFKKTSFYFNSQRYPKIILFNRVYELKTEPELLPFWHYHPKRWSNIMSAFSFQWFKHLYPHGHPHVEPVIGKDVWATGSFQRGQHQFWRSLMQSRTFTSHFCYSKKYNLKPYTMKLSWRKNVPSRFILLVYKKLQSFFWKPNHVQHVWPKNVPNYQTFVYKRICAQTISDLFLKFKNSIKIPQKKSNFFIKILQKKFLALIIKKHFLKRKLFFSKALKILKLNFFSQKNILKTPSLGFKAKLGPSTKVKRKKILKLSLQKKKWSVTKNLKRKIFFSNVLKKNFSELDPQEKLEKEKTQKNNENKLILLTDHESNSYAELKKTKKNRQVLKKQKPHSLQFFSSSLTSKTLYKLNFYAKKPRIISKKKTFHSLQFFFSSLTKKSRLQKRALKKISSFFPAVKFLKVLFEKSLYSTFFLDRQIFFALLLRFFFLDLKGEQNERYWKRTIFPHNFRHTQENPNKYYSVSRPANRVNKWLNPVMYNRKLFVFHLLSVWTCQKKHPSQRKSYKVYKFLIPRLYPQRWYPGIRLKNMFRIKQLLLRKILLPTYENLTPKQLVQIRKKAWRIKTLSIENARADMFLGRFERRLDILVYKLNFAASIQWARSYVLQGLIYVSYAENLRVCDYEHRLDKNQKFPLLCSFKTKLVAFFKKSIICGLFDKKKSYITAKMFKAPSPKTLPSFRVKIKSIVHWGVQNTKLLYYKKFFKRHMPGYFIQNYNRTINYFFRNLRRKDFSKTPSERVKDITFDFVS